MRQVLITTTDNPFDPVTDFLNWYTWDMAKGYDTCGYLARITTTPDSLSDELNTMEVEAAIDEMVRLQLAPYKKIVYDTADLKDEGSPVQK